MVDLVEQIRALVCRLGKLRQLGPDEDFYNAGFSSVSALELLLELEAECGVSIPDEQFVTARTVRDLSTLVAGRQKEQAA
jgi:acyl carrier protein